MVSSWYLVLGDGRSPFHCIYPFSPFEFCILCVYYMCVYTVIPFKRKKWVRILILPSRVSHTFKVKHKQIILKQ